ncbi:uncharacterized protein LOC142578040 [Dermacentor variabilis]|uniref:uncharacterized protein LOC142578040 n=1 Tax=Dermacentor variabilis TaxID=34621 RepID=UPI003F5B5F86
MATVSLFAVVFLSAAQMLFADSPSPLTDCSPRFLSTHGKLIRVGCTETCTNSQQSVKVMQPGAECTNISTDTAEKMQPFLGYYCPVGRCSGSNCELNGLYLECWNTNSQPTRRPT